MTTYSKLLTELEGLKLDLMISESKIDNKIRTNNDVANRPSSKINSEMLFNM
jgi:hypothetical protein